MIMRKISEGDQMIRSHGEKIEEKVDGGSMSEVEIKKMETVHGILE